MGSPALPPVARARPPVRATQSFVGVMARMARRPRLVALEVAWRWVFWVILVGGLVAWVRALGATVSFDPAGAIAELTGNPKLLELLHGFVGGVEQARKPLQMWPLPLVLWGMLRLGGRKLLLRRLGGLPSRNYRAAFALGLIRVGVLGLAWWAVLWGSAQLAERLVLEPLALGNEPQLLPFFALVIPGVLVIFLVWMLGSYVFDLAAVHNAASGDGVFRSLGRALRPGPAGIKLVEINLVLGIVKIALLVLALVFSASPLPFTLVATPQFLVWWWGGLLLLYFVASDYFHVVRVAAYLALLEAMAEPMGDGAAAALPAS